MRSCGSCRDTATRLSRKAIKEVVERSLKNLNLKHFEKFLLTRLVYKHLDEAREVPADHFELCVKDRGRTLKAAWMTITIGQPIVRVQENFAGVVTAIFDGHENATIVEVKAFEAVNKIAVGMFEWRATGRTARRSLHLREWWAVRAWRLPRESLLTVW